MSTAPTSATSLGFLRAKAAGEDSAKPVFRLSSGVLDRHRDRVRPEAVSIEEFLLNPVLLWNHCDNEPAIGTARVYREGDEWLMEPSFDGIGERSKEVAAKVAANTLRTCSFKFVIDDAETNAEGGLDYLAVRVVEASITNVPANQESIRLKNANPPPVPPPETPPPAPAAKGLEQADLDALEARMDAKLAPLIEALTALTEEEPAEAPVIPEKPKAVEPPSSEDEAAKSFFALLQGRR